MIYLKTFLMQNHCYLMDDNTLTVFERNSVDLTVAATLAMSMFIANNLKLNLVKHKWIHFKVKSNSNLVSIEGEEEI